MKRTVSQVPLGIQDGKTDLDIDMEPLTQEKVFASIWHGKSRKTPDQDQRNGELSKIGTDQTASVLLSLVTDVSNGAWIPAD